MNTGLIGLIILIIVINIAQRIIKSITSAQSGTEPAKRKTGPSGSLLAELIEAGMRKEGGAAVEESPEAAAIEEAPREAAAADLEAPGTDIYGERAEWREDTFEASGKFAGGEETPSVETGAPAVPGEKPWAAPPEPEAPVYRHYEGIEGAGPRRKIELAAAPWEREKSVRDLLGSPQSVRKAIVLSTILGPCRARSRRRRRF